MKNLDEYKQAVIGGIEIRSIYKCYIVRYKGKVITYGGFRNYNERQYPQLIQNIVMVLRNELLAHNVRTLLYLDLDYMSRETIIEKAVIEMIDNGVITIEYYT